MATCPECGSELTDAASTPTSRQDKHARVALRALHELRESLRGSVLQEGLDVVIRQVRDIVTLIREWRQN